MKLKYYLRGLGIGIVVTAVIMGIASGNRTLSDREIKERAAALGMVEQGGSLADMEAALEESQEAEGEATGDSEEEETAENSFPTGEPAGEAGEASEEGTAKAGEEADGEETDEAGETVNGEESGGDEAGETDGTAEGKSDTGTEASETGESESSAVQAETATIEIKAGDGSYTVCQRLEAAGLIASAGDFDSYLAANGYDRKLRTGSYEIPLNAEPEEIAKLLTQG